MSKRAWLVAFDLTGVILFGALGWTLTTRYVEYTSAEAVRDYIAGIEAQKVVGSEAYYGGRSDWYAMPCCVTLNRWRTSSGR